MGCICSCHDRMSAFALRGCCWECERDHDPLRNALIQKDEAVTEVAELQSALEDCLALLKAVEEQSGPERMKQFRVDPYGTIADAGARLLLSRRVTEGHKSLKPKCLRCGTEIPAGGHACGPVNQS